MIMVTGGLGFIGTHTVRALLDQGESCVLAQRRASGPPGVLAGEAGGRVLLEQVDITDLAALLKVGTRHEITGIVHLAGSVPWPPGADLPIDAARTAIGGLLNVFQAALDWGVPRVGVASTIGVYDGPGEGALSEDTPLPLTAHHVIPAFKKIGELLTDHISAATGIELINYRISAIWGPLGRPASPFFAAPRLVHAAAHGEALDLATSRPPAYAGTGIDMCYVKDCARAIALLQVSDRLRHRTYNVAGGRATTNAEVAAAIAAVVPEARIDLAEGRDPDAPAHDTYLDITRLQEDTVYRPAYDLERAVADYVAWLRAGNAR